MTAHEVNARLVKEYRAARESAEAVRLAVWLLNNITPEMAEAHDPISEIFALAGMNASKHEQRAREIQGELLVANKGMLVKFAKRWARPQTEDDMKDALQAARMGLLRALEDFDPELGSFSTHVGNHTRDYVQRFSGKNESVTRPRSANMPVATKRAAEKFRLLHGREATAAELGVTETQLSDWLSATHFVQLDGEPDDEHRPRFELTSCTDEDEYEARAEALDKAWKEAVGDLSPRNRDIAERVLLKGQDAREAGAVYGLTHASATKVCKRIENRLRRALNPATAKAEDDPWRKNAEANARYRARRRALSVALSAKTPIASRESPSEPCPDRCNNGWRPVGDLPCPRCNDGARPRCPNACDPAVKP